MIRHSKFDWDYTLVEFTVDNLKVLTFNWDCTLVKSENANKLIETLHDGHTNQYIFFINGKKTTLLTLSP